MNQIEITDIKIMPKSSGHLRAFVNITVNNSLYINGLKIVEGANGLFVSFPSRESNGKWFDVVAPTSREIRGLITQKILEEYSNAKHNPENENQDNFSLENL